MMRFGQIRTVFCAVGLLLLAAAAFAAPPERSALATFLAGGGTGNGAQAPTAPGTPGSLWDNGASNLVNALSSERSTLISGSGGPEGDAASNVADDFSVGSPVEITEIRACLYHDGTSAEAYIYQDAAGAPGPSVTQPLWGGPTTVSLVASTFTDNTARCANAFNLPGREWVFRPADVGLTIKLSPGTYWLAVVGEGGTRSFWGTSSPSLTLGQPVWGSVFFGVTYWTSTIGQASDQPGFAFDIDGVPQRDWIEVPALGPAGLAALALALAGAALLLFRRSAHRA
jgi:hypothetical protein